MVTPRQVQSLLEQSSSSLWCFIHFSKYCCRKGTNTVYSSWTSWNWTRQTVILRDIFFLLGTKHFSRQKHRHLEWNISDMGWEREREKNAGNGKLESRDKLEGSGERYIWERKKKKVCSEECKCEIVCDHSWLRQLQSWTLLRVSQSIWGTSSPRSFTPPFSDSLFSYGSSRSLVLFPH